jgi:hypothetical protein
MNDVDEPNERGETLRATDDDVGDEQTYEPSNNDDRQIVAKRKQRRFSAKSTGPNKPQMIMLIAYQFDSVVS